MEIDNVKDCIEVKIHAGLVIENKTFELCMDLIAAYARNEGLKGLDIRFSDFGKEKNGMNLRQKCKKLKQENERLKTRTVHVVYKEVGCKLTTIVVRREIPIFMRHEIPEKDLMEYIAREFAGNLLPYIKFEHIDNPNRGTTIIEGRIKVAEMGQIL